jgi:PilZ domain/RDD family
MQVVPFPARHARLHYRHTLRTLNYVTLGASNGGIIRNLNSKGMAMQALSSLAPQQHVQVRFDLKFPRVHVETEGQVSWANSSGECGIRFVGLPTRTVQQINEWILSNLLEIADRHTGSLDGIFAGSASLSAQGSSVNEDGLVFSTGVRAPIRLGSRYRHSEQITFDDSVTELATDADTNWLSRPLSGRTLAWIIDGLLVLAGLLLFAFVFLTMTHELPSWPLTLGVMFAAALVIGSGYCVLFTLFGGRTLGARLTQSESKPEKKEYSSAGRFR